MTTELPRITHMPSRAFSPFGLLSVASSRTTLRKTLEAHQPLRQTLRILLSHIISSEGSHHLARAIELDFDALVEVLCSSSAYIFKCSRRMGHGVGLVQGGAFSFSETCDSPSSVLAALEAYRRCYEMWW